MNPNTSVSIFLVSTNLKCKKEFICQNQYSDYVILRIVFIFDPSYEMHVNQVVI